MGPVVATRLVFLGVEAHFVHLMHQFFFEDVRVVEAQLERTCHMIGETRSVFRVWQARAPCIDTLACNAMLHLARRGSRRGD